MKRKNAGTNDFERKEKKRKLVIKLSKPQEGDNENQNLLSNQKRKRQNYNVDDDFVPPPDPPKTVYFFTKKIQRQMNHPVIRTMNEGMKKCYELHIRLMNQKDCYIFNEPVDPEKWGLDDYFQRIKEPMDLGTILKRIYNKEYNSMIQWAADVRLVWRNCFTYNKPDSWVHELGKKLKAYFEKEWEKLVNNEYFNQRPYLEEHEIKKSSTTVTPRKIKRIELAKKFNHSQKLDIFEKIKNLSPKQLAHLVEIYKASESIEVDSNEDVEFSLKNLSDRTLSLFKYFVDTFVKRKHIKKIA